MSRAIVFVCRSLLVAALSAFGFGFANATTLLDVPGSIPGSTTVFATEGGISVGTYSYDTGVDPFGYDSPWDATYGFIYDGSSYETFVSSYTAAPPSNGTLIDCGLCAFDQVRITAFDKTGGIGYVESSPFDPNGQIERGWIRSGIQNDFSSAALLYLVINGPGNSAPAPDGGTVDVVSGGEASIPTFINSSGQVVGNFYNCGTDVCWPGLVTFGGQFLISGGHVYFNYVVNGPATSPPVDYADLHGLVPGQQVIGFVENGNSGTFRPVSEPTTLALLGLGLWGMALTSRKKLH